MDVQCVAERRVIEHRRQLEAEARAHQRRERSPAPTRLRLARLLIAVAHRLAPPVETTAPVATTVA